MYSLLLTFQLQCRPHTRGFASTYTALLTLSLYPQSSSSLGDRIEIGDVLFEVETDKAVMGMESNEEGFLAKIIVSFVSLAKRTENGRRDTHPSHMHNSDDAPKDGRWRI